jgi:tricorn protease
MEMVLQPKEEWKQIFNDTWRRYRDFFYDPNMHQVDWNGMRKSMQPCWKMPLPAGMC